MFRNKTARQHNFAVVPKADIPRSKFRMVQNRKQAFNASELIPIMVEEVLPGDTWQHREALAARLATPIAPVLDDLDIETWYFFVPNRIANPEYDWEAFITGSNTGLTVPTITPYETAGPSVIIQLNSVFDHMGLLPQTYSTAIEFNALPIWSYFTIWNEWFRDQNLQTAYTFLDPWANGTVSTNIKQGLTSWDQKCLRVNKRHDYFTSSLPWPQKGTAVSLPLGTSAPVIPHPSDPPVFTSVGGAVVWPGPSTQTGISAANASDTVRWSLGAAGSADQIKFATQTGLLADLTNATAATINSLRLAFQTQKLLERDARGGSRYVEQLLAHFGVRSPDYRLQRPEYLGGSRVPITINPIAQTATYGAEPDPETESALGNLGAEMHAQHSKRTFTYASTEHGYIIGVAAVRATPQYQQGTRRHWRRDTRLSYYFPVFAMLGEQAVATQEIYQPANNTPSNATWGYQERWAEYRYTPNEITGVLRSTVSTPMDWWHLAEEFGSEPALNAAFITDKTQEVLSRALAIDTTSSTQWAAQIIMDIRHESVVARMMPTYSVPGLIDHF